MSSTLADAQSLILERFKKLTLQDVGTEFTSYFSEKGHNHDFHINDGADDLPDDRTGSQQHLSDDNAN